MCPELCRRGQGGEAQVALCSVNVQHVSHCRLEEREKGEAWLGRLASGDKHESQAGLAHVMCEVGVPPHERGVGQKRAPV